MDSEVKSELSLDEFMEKLNTALAAIKRMEKGVGKMAVEATSVGEMIRIYEGVVGIEVSGLDDLSKVSEAMGKNRSEIYRAWRDLCKGKHLLEGEPLLVGQIVYSTKPGWENVRLEVVDFTPGKMVTVKGALGTNIRGEYSERLGAHIKDIPLSKLSRTPNVMETE